MGLQGSGDGALLAFGIVILAVVLIVAGALSAMNIFAARRDRAKRTRRALSLCAKSLVAVVLIMLTVNYGLDVRLRLRAHDCERKQSDDGKYVAELCLLRDNGHDADYVGRVYDAKGGQLLVERTFDAAETELSWLNGQVSFMRGGDDSDVVRLPASWVERLLARAP
ncbi:hypothetical protein [Paraburkholderia phenoliruptrix]|uniref:hypothetical protein n=1 Tax=Paraburkholderia phenoliruptrix TaxID=252970 RepID=UPI002869BB2D|nr:hypothetical protein [Paraburkholderia phenoliruptrix]WMY07331.1 hypothetical protein P3F88_13750 [Paraburkholderia phenoliruptrix]